MIAGETICSISTPAGSGAIAIIRLSGKDAITVSEKIFVPQKKVELKKSKGFTIHYGKIMDEEQLIDEVLLSVFKKNRSFTGEETVEISCHGSLYIQQKILELLIKQGVRLAQPGEFTQRAFLNGRMDLSQAEAVADLIASTNAVSHKMAIQQMRGGFSEKIKKLRKELLHFNSLIELELDFSEEDVAFADRKELKQLLLKISAIIADLKDSFRQGNAIKTGIPVVIVGETNVGKSTLLNVLLNEEKAIVSHIQGTTRDAIEDTVNIQGMGFRFIDTAGLRETTDTIESMGIERTYQKLKRSTIVLLMIDAQKDLTVQNVQIQQIRKKISTQKLIILANKIDRIDKEKLAKISKIRLENDEKLCLLSAKTKANLSLLINLLVETAKKYTTHTSHIVVNNVRHYEALQKAYNAIERSMQGLDSILPVDLLTQDIRETLHYLAEITGEITTEEILGAIFSKFCIGK